MFVFLGEAKTGNFGKDFRRFCKDESQLQQTYLIDAESKLNKRQLRFLFLTLLFRPIWCHTPVYTSRWPLTLQLSQPRKPTTNSWVSLRSQLRALNLLTRWWSATLDMENTWPAVSCFVVTWCRRTLMQPLRVLRPKELFSLWIGVRQDSRYIALISS